MKNIIRDFIKGLELPELASYGKDKAIFEVKAPDDQDYKWEEGCSQFGRVIYDLDMKDDTERKISGILRIMVAYANEADGKGENNLSLSSDKLQKAFDNTFFSTKELTIGTVWRKSQGFKEKINQDIYSGIDDEVLGEILTFDVYAFPALSYGCMDPVKSLANDIEKKWPNAKIINFGQLPKVWKPEKRMPAVYVRFENMGKATFPSTHACTWHSVNLRLHIIAENDNEVNELSTYIIYDLSERERFPMGDGSPFFVQRCTFNKSLDVLKDGQVTIQGQYGVLRRTKQEQLMKHINVERK